MAICATAGLRNSRAAKQRRCVADAETVRGFSIRSSDAAGHGFRQADVARRSWVLTGGSAADATGAVQSTSTTTLIPLLPTLQDRPGRLAAATAAKGLACERGRKAQDS